MSPAPGELLIADPEAQRVFRFTQGSQRTAGSLTTYAGSGERCTVRCCDGGPDAAALDLAAPSAVAILPSGDGLITNSHAGCVLKRSTSGAVTRFAGSGRRDTDSGDGGRAGDARLDGPSDVAVWAGHGVLITEEGGCRVRLVDERGVVTTVAGTGDCGFDGDDGAAIAAKLSAPASVAITPDGGGFVISDTDNGRVRAVDSEGVIRTIAGTGHRGLAGVAGPATQAEINEAEGVAFVGGTLWVADTDNDMVRCLDGGRLEPVALRGAGGVPLRLHYPMGIVRFDGGVAIADTDHHRIVVAALDGGQARVLIGPESEGDSPVGGLPTADREQRTERLRQAPDGARPSLFEALTADLDLDPADRSARWETLPGPDRVEDFRRLLERATRRN